MMYPTPSSDHEYVNRDGKCAVCGYPGALHDGYSRPRIQLRGAIYASLAAVFITFIVHALILGRYLT